nr:MULTISPECIES: helix-turn-helix domain-containing protein [unclassified Leucobacter]
MPIRAGNIPLGSIWVIDPTGDDLATPLAPEKEDALRSAANIAASYIVDAWRFDHGDERSKEAALRRVLAGTQHVNDFTVLGIRSDRQYLVAAIDGTSATEGDVSEIRAAASRHLSVYFPGSTCAVVDGRVLAVVPALSRENVARSLERLLPELERLTGVHCHCGVSEPSHPGSFAEDTERAIRIADCARDLGLTVAGADAVQAQLVLRACNDALQGADLRLPETEQLLAENEAETRATLLAWLEERGNAPRVAERLNLHEQTVRYRVRKATARLGIDLDDPDRTLALWLQLRLAELG